MDESVLPAGLHLTTEEMRDEALAILLGERELLAGIGVTGDLRLVGGRSVVGALTKGDVDLHLRVVPEDFGPVVLAIGDAHTPVLREIWAPTLATFDVAAQLPTGLAVTPVGSEHDIRFTRSWQLLAADPGLLAQYNAVKLVQEHPDAGYEAAKSAFFDRLVALP